MVLGYFRMKLINGKKIIPSVKIVVIYLKE